MQNRSVWFVHIWEAHRTRLLPLALLTWAPLVCFGQEPSPTPSPSEMEAEPIVVTATRFDIPLDLSPASASVITSEDFEQKQIERVSDALREVPGLSVVQTGVAGQLTSVFTRGLRSEHTQVLLDGIPINQGLQGAFNFADFTTDARRCYSNFHEAGHRSSRRHVRCRGWLLRHVSRMDAERREDRTVRLFDRRKPPRH